MFDWSSIFALVAQALLAVLSVDLLRRAVFPALDALPGRGLVTEVWVPLTVVIPMLFFLSRTHVGSVEGAAWPGVCGPIVCAIIGLGGALVVNRPSVVRMNVASKALWTGTGLVLLLLGAAHHLTLWMGQCAFALAAVLLWTNTPDDENDSAVLGAAQVRAGFAMTLTVVAAAGQGIASIFVQAELLAISGAITVACGAMIVTGAARFAGSDSAVRISGWTMAYGILLGLGVLSLLRLIPAAYRAAAEGTAPPIQRIAHGFDAFWIEATAALAFAAAVSVMMRLPITLKRIAGLALIVAAAVLAAWRLANV